MLGLDEGVFKLDCVPGGGCSYVLLLRRLKAVLDEYCSKSCVGEHACRGRRPRESIILTLPIFHLFVLPGTKGAFNLMHLCHYLF